MNGDEVDAALEPAKRKMLSLATDWDGDGARPPTLATWDRAVGVVKKVVLACQEKFGVTPPLPDPDPCADGSIDLEWEEGEGEGRFTLLANVPAEPEKKVGYYGDRGADSEVKVKDDGLEGDDLDARLPVVARWLARGLLAKEADRLSALAQKSIERHYAELEDLAARFHALYRDMPKKRCVHAAAELFEFLADRWHENVKAVHGTVTVAGKRWEHAWVEVDVGGRTFVVDPTGPQQFGFKQVVTPKEEYLSQLGDAREGEKL